MGSANINRVGWATLLRTGAGALMALGDGISLGGRLGKETTIQALTSAAKVLDPNGPAVEATAAPPATAVRNAADVLWVCHDELIGLGIDTSGVAQELDDYFAVLSGTKGRLGKLNISGGAERKSWHFEVPRRPN